MEVAKKLGSGEMHLGLHLGVGTDAIKGLQRDNKGNYHDLVHSILEQWNKDFVGSRSEMEKQLCAAFKEIGRNDIVRFIKSCESACIISHFQLLIFD